MTRQHDIAHYLDGRRWIPYCKVCSAEGEQLTDDCQKHPPGHFYCEDQGEKAKNTLDDKNQTAK